MGRYSFDLASPADDAELRRVLAETPTDGKIVVSFRREPGFFAAECVNGPSSQTVVCRDNEVRRVVGFGVRSCRDMFINGVATGCGYLSSLRVRPEYRSFGLLARGYAFFRELHEDGRTPLYVTTIAQGNDRALKVLTSGRATLPKYHFAGEYITAALPVIRRRANGANFSGLQIRQATQRDIANLCRFLNEHGPARQFFPCYSEADFGGNAGTFCDLQHQDLLLAIRNGEIVGTLGVWNQTRFRQTVVERYSTGLRWAKPLYNGWSRLRGRPPLPRVGQPFRYASAAVPVVVDNHVHVWSALLDAAVRRVAETDAGHLLVGLHEMDPLLALVRVRRPIEYVTRVYLVCWDDGEQLRRSLDDRVPYLELGTL